MCKSDKLPRYCVECGIEKEKVKNISVIGKSSSSKANRLFQVSKVENRVKNWIL